MAATVIRQSHRNRRNRYTTVPPQPLQPLYASPAATTATAIRGCPKKPPFVKPARAESAAMSSGDERTPSSRHHLTFFTFSGRNQSIYISNLFQKKLSGLVQSRQGLTAS